MKKFLSLVLALVMTMSLVTISAGAKDFTDDDSITYAEAIDVMSAVKVVEGYPDGSFMPEKTLTRAEAAKIICNMILGPTTAAALKADTAPFSDVPANHWAAGYIAYCANQGIIGGYGNGVFGVNDQLDGFSFMKMLLCALGYDAEVELYVGPNWSINVAKRALNLGLDDGLTDEFNGVKAVTREEACLYALNTLKADMVEYDAKTSVSVGGAEVVIAGSKAQAVEYKDGKYDGNIGDRDNVQQFAEKYFTDLRLDDWAQDDFARPSNLWKLKAEEIGTYVKTADATYTKKVEVGTIYKDLGLGKTLDKDLVFVYENGDLKEAKSVDLKKGDDDNKFGGKGVLTEVFYGTYGDVDYAVITCIDAYVGQINKTVKATAKRDAYIVIDTEAEKPDGVGSYVEFETDETFEDDAYVVYTYSQDADAVKSVYVTEIVNGTVSRAVNDEIDEDETKSVTIDGTEYDASENIAGVDVGEVSVNNDYNLYLDKYGYIIYIEEDEFLSSDYALVVDAQNKSNFSSNRALLVFADGTEKVVDTAKDYKTTGTKNYIPDGTIVTYKVEDGVYTLKPVKATLGTFNDNGQDTGSYVGTYTASYKTQSFVMTNDKAGIKLSDTTDIQVREKDTSTGVMETNAPATPIQTVTANSKTVFVVWDNTDKEYSVYTGIKNAPSIDADTGSDDVEVYTYCKNGTMATVMFIFVDDGTIITDDNHKNLFLAGESVSDLIHDADGDYFEYEAWVNGEITTVKVDDSVGNGLNGLYKSYSIDKHGVITNVSTTGAHGFTGYSTGNSDEYLVGTGVNKISADYTVILDTAGTSKTITVADDAKIFAVDKKGNITESSYRSISKDGNDIAYAYVDDYLVKTLFIEEVEGEDITPTYNVLGSSNVKFCETVDGIYTTTLSGVDKGTKVFVKADNDQEVIKCATLSLTQEQAPTDSQPGIYSFTISGNVATSAFTTASLVKVTKSTATKTVDGVTYTVTTPAVDLYVEAGEMVDVTVTVSGIATGTTAAVVTVTGATGVTNPVPSTDSVVASISAAATAANKVTFTPADHDYYNATYTFKAVVGTAMSFAVA